MILFFVNVVLELTFREYISCFWGKREAINSKGDVLTCYNSKGESYLFDDFLKVTGMTGGICINLSISADAPSNLYHS